MTSTRERPLFSPSRRPPAPAVIAPPDTAALVQKPAEPDHPQWALIGTVSGETDGIGVFLDQSRNEIVKLKVGEGHDGWNLRSVWHSKALLEKGNVTAVLVIPAPSTKPAQNMHATAPPDSQHSQR